MVRPLVGSLRYIRRIREKIVAIPQNRCLIKLILHHFIINAFKVDNKVLKIWHFTRRLFVLLSAIKLG